MTRHTSLKSLFNETDVPPRSKPRSKKRPAPVSLRLNETELAALRNAASGRSINGYIRERLFGDASIITLAKPVAQDREALARVLGALGQSDLYTRIAAITLALEQGRMLASAETETAVKDACNAVTEMRADLLIALGLRKA